MSGVGRSARRGVGRGSAGTRRRAVTRVVVVLGLLVGASLALATSMAPSLAQEPPHAPTSEPAPLASYAWTSGEDAAFEAHVAHVPILVFLRSGGDAGALERLLAAPEAPALAKDLPRVLVDARNPDPVDVRES